MSTFKFSLVSLEGRVFEDEITSLSAPGASGRFGVLPRHAQMVAGLTTGLLDVKLPGEKEKRIYVVSGGVCDVRKNEVIVFCDKAEKASNKDHAEKLLSTTFTVA